MEIEARELNGTELKFLFSNWLSSIKCLLQLSASSIDKKV